MQRVECTERKNSFETKKTTSEVYNYTLHPSDNWNFCQFMDFFWLLLCAFKNFAPVARNLNTAVPKLPITARIASRGSFFIQKVVLKKLREKNSY